MFKLNTSHLTYRSPLKLLTTSSFCLLAILAIAALFLPAQSAQAFPGTGEANSEELAIPAQQSATLSVQVLSAPYAMVAVSNPSTGPRLTVVHARVTNTSGVTANDVLVTLKNYADQTGWLLATGEDPERFVKTLAAGATYDAYWLVTYPLAANQSNPYNVTAKGTNTNEASTSATMTTKTANRVGNSNLGQTDVNVQVGFEFTLDADFEVGNNIEGVLLVPAGNIDFDAGSYRLVGVQARVFRMDTNATVATMSNLVFTTNPAIGALPNNVDVGIEATFTFLALAPSNTQICPVAASDSTSTGSGLKFDNDFCTDASQLGVNGKLTIEMSKTSSAPQSGTPLQGRIEQGDVMTYTINYNNTFTKAVNGVWIWDTPPANVTVDESSFTKPKDTTESTPNMIVWNIGTVGPLSSGQIKFRVTANGTGATLADGTPLVNSAFLSINPERFTAQSILTRSVTTLIKAPNIALSKTDGKTTANPGELLTYTINLNNVGGAAAKSLIVTDTLPSLVTLNGTTTPPWDNKVGQTLIWNTATLAGKNQIIVPVAVKANVPSTQNIVNTVEATYQNSFGFKSKKTATDTTQAQAGTAEIAELNVTKTATPEDNELNVGDLVTYTITVENIDAVDTANNVTVIDNLPDGVICQSVSVTVNGPIACDDQFIVWSINSLPPGESESMEIVVLLGPATEGQNVINTIEVTGPNIDPIDPGDIEVCADGTIPNPNCGSTPQPPNDTTVDVRKTAEDLNGAPLAVGDTLRYTIEVENTGNDPAFELEVIDDLSPHVLCLSVSGATNPPAECADPLIWQIPLLNEGQTVSLTIDVLIKPSGAGQDIINSVSLTGDNVNGGTNNATVCPDNSAPPCTTDPTVVPVNVAVTKTSQDVNGGQLEIGDTLLYTIQAKNNGNLAAFNIQITDNLPDQVTCQNISADKNQPEGCDDPLIWTISRLDPGETATLTIDVSINQNAAGQSIINSLSVTGDNIADITNPPQVCPDGSSPVGGVCATTPTDPNAEGPPVYYLPLITKP